MSGFDDLCACFAMCTCCCAACNEASGLFCFYKSCFCCNRRSMNDNDFERTVEELYAPQKDTTHAPNDAAAHRAHILELETRAPGTGTDTTTVVNAQPGARPSMEARAVGEPRGERRDRTREWVSAHAHSKSDAPQAAPREHSRPRSKSHVDGDAARLDGEGAVPGVGGGSGSVRGRPRVPAQGEASDAQAYATAWKKSLDGGARDAASVREVPEVPDDRAEVQSTPGKGEGGDSEEQASIAQAAPLERKSSAPRLDIPASLRPGRPSSWMPSQFEIPFQPQAAGEQGKNGGAS
ncbi:hypothetical protein C2E23DRAFT_752738 [Lenzites betulinus]|nr:hypothetical protein C2E23DRAFT_752738 [Lenzites betulinus]